LYSQSIDAAKLEAQEEIALAITKPQRRISPITPKRIFVVPSSSHPMRAGF
jgi:hypothetical protein